ncbi:Bug family tripartite tricarboxylate transporter substrate binding protein [Teichococcus vastitatis]|jgi:tripartite-type tricarboxylate transporter receptor subunit TctC|uniref:Tripartite tricarboxylate transporter substrate binding protein n=1 Tax=Teichococcus vastitatis TaxID=2307076 RepID=A0ABS9WAI2_9PROT|nr:tripartite tricarboxylate transporter substrate binding protein [Pseudoroseomonas vastitatis]MCI0756304.1 tripartite tricarboxylate transporter substrate binding protein [Pseudoroseomonas vastitatis]
MLEITRRRGLATVGTALIAAATGCAAAVRAEEAWPQRPVTIIIGFPPGTATDSVGRLLADRLSRSLGQRFIIENRSGQGGSIGAAAVARATPDGYTITIGASAPQAINPHIYPDLPYDPRKDFTPVEQLVQLPYMLVAGKHTAFRSVADIVDKARAQPGTVTYATTGNGTTSQLMMAMLAKEAGVRMTHVPYRGTAQSLTDIVAGRVDITFDTMIGTLPFARDGRVRAIAVGTKARVPIALEIPTTAEAGFPGTQGGAWLGVFGPAALPAPVVRRLHTEIEAVLADTAFQRAIAEMGAVMDAAGPEDFAKIVRDDYNRWGEIVRVTGTRLE